MDISDLLSSALRGERGGTLSQAFALELERSGLSASQVSRLLGLQRRTLEQILSGEGKGHDVTQVLKVGAFCGLDVAQTLAVYLAKLPKEKVREIQDAIELARLNSLFPLKELKAIGLISNDKDLRSIVARVKDFFELDTLDGYETLVHQTLFAKTRRQNKSERMLDFWTTASIRLFEQVSNPNPYDRQALLDIVPHIRTQSEDVERGLHKVARALFAAGVTVAFQPKVPNTNIKGATLYVDDNPCVVITDHGRNYAALWFYLMHELYHVLYNLDFIRDWKFHLTGAAGLQLQLEREEARADEFARDMLCSYDKLDALGQLIHNPFAVKTKAKRWRVHPSIVYAAYQYRMHERGENYWGAFRNQFPKFDKAVAQLNQGLWDQPTIAIAGQRLRASLSSRPVPTAPA